MKHFVSLVVVFFLFACKSEVKPEFEVQVYSGKALGTSFQIQFFHGIELEIGQQIDSTFQVLNNSLSTYIPSSDISKINQGDSTITVDQQFISNFQASKEIYSISDGYFDPTVGILVNAYGFGPVKYDIEMNQNVIDSLMQFVGLDKVVLDVNNRIVKTHPETFLDFNSIAKGYAVDRLAALLSQFGVHHFLVEVGGELVAKGRNLDSEQLWKIGIDKPFESDSSNREIIEFVFNLEDRAMATSGNYRKFKMDEFGNKFVHTINPKTGKSEASDVLSASVFAENCMLADAYATAFIAMGFDKTIELLPKLQNVDVLIIYSKGKEVDTYISKNLIDFISE